MWGNLLVSAHEKYVDHPLFRSCIEISCPKGWIIFLDKAVSLLEEYNKTAESKVGFGQVKTKFGMLTIYIEYYGENEEEPFTYVSEVTDAGIYEKINSLSSEALNYCKVCGKETTEMVIETRVKKVCFDHFPKNGYGMRF